MTDDHLTTFAAQVSHDLRTPLTAIVANAEMLAQEPVVAGDPDATWMVEGIQRASRRMEAMIEQMLGYARLGGTPQLSETDLGSVLERVLEELATTIKEAAAEVTTGELPTLACDADQISVVLRNVVGNAVRFSRPGEPPRITVGATRCNGGWRVEVSDNGIGVPADRRAGMFVLFSRMDKRVEGDGIGLATAARLVAGHGGRIGMDASDAGGTTVWFELPA